MLFTIDELPTQNLGVKSVDTQIAALEAEIERYKDLKSKVCKMILLQEVSAVNLQKRDRKSVV